MNRKMMITALFASISLSFASQAVTEKKAEPKKQTHCPVMQRYEVEYDIYIDIKGYRIYTCCKGCTSQIKANPDKYIQRMKDLGVTIEKAPTKKADEKQKVNA